MPLFEVDRALVARARFDRRPARRGNPTSRLALFMRGPEQDAQSVLSGIMREDYAAIATGAKRSALHHQVPPAEIAALKQHLEGEYEGFEHWDLEAHLTAHALARVADKRDARAVEAPGGSYSPPVSPAIPSTARACVGHSLA